MGVHQQVSEWKQGLLHHLKDAHAFPDFGAHSFELDNLLVLLGKVLPHES